MSGQYPVGYNSPVGGHRGNYSNQIANMNQIVQNQMGMINAGILPQQTQQQANAMGQLSGPNINNPIQMQSYNSVQQNNPQMQQSLAQQSQPQNAQQQQLALQNQIPSVPNTMVVPSQQTMQQRLGEFSPKPQQQPHSSMLSAPKEINIVGLSRLGQETVQDISSRFQEIFSALKTMQPTCNREGSTEKKVQEYFRTIRLLFKRLRIIYEKCNDGYPQGMEYTHVESLIPYKDEPDHRAEATQCEEYRKALQENRELIETVMFKNKQLREIIDRTRIIIWEINTMLTMRRS